MIDFLTIEDILNMMLRDIKNEESDNYDYYIENLQIMGFNI